MTHPAPGAIDLASCESEPIHIPGSIQPHGALLVLSPDTLRIEQVAGNLTGLLGAAPEDLLGHPVDAWFGAEAVVRLREALKAQQHLRRPLPAFAMLPERDGKLAGPPVDAIVHENDGIVLLELEPADAPGPYDALAVVRAMLLDAQGAMSVPEFCHAVAEGMRAVTGFDRVMVYRFLPDGSGTVEAEARAPDIERFLGLRFPAADIPRQARELYRHTLLRLIPDALYAPAPLQPALNPTTLRPPDLSRCALRSVSPFHREYLANMGVAASMSVSLVLHGTLWGLIVCHHRTPHFLPHRLRVACELFAEMASFQLEARVTAQDLEARIAAKQILEQLMIRLAREASVEDGLIRYHPNLLDYIPADGVALWFGGKATTLGRTPPATEIGDIAAWLNTQPEGVIATHHLAAVVPAAAAYAELASGMLALSLSKASPDYVLWFRPELAQTVTWAGDPHLPEKSGANGERPSPRKSFAAWRQAVRFQSQPWHTAEIEAATALRLALLEVVLRRLDTEAQEREAARQRQNMLMAELDHRVKNMLATIQALVDQSQGGTETLGGFLANFEGRLRAMSRAHSLLTKGRWEGADLRLLIAEEMAPFMGGALPAAVIAAAAPAVGLRPKAALALSLAVHELATNAAKYGALSVQGGCVNVDWHAEQRSGGQELVLRWRETGGPAVAEPTRRGFGLTLIETNLSYELGGSVQLGFPAEGLTCTVLAPWDQIASPANLLPPPQVAGSRVMPAALTGARVLVVEDNALLAAVIVTGLKMAGVAVVGPVPRLPAEIELAETAEIDVAILDIDLDGAMVWPVADRLVSRGIPFIFSTGYEASLVVPPQFADRPVLTKPFTIRELRGALARLLEELRSGSEAGWRKPSP